MSFSAAIETKKKRKCCVLLVNQQPFKALRLAPASFSSKATGWDVCDESARIPTWWLGRLFRTNVASLDLCSCIDLDFPHFQSKNLLSSTDEFTNLIPITSCLLSLQPPTDHLLQLLSDHVAISISTAPHVPCLIIHTCLNAPLQLSVFHFKNVFFAHRKRQLKSEPTLTCELCIKRRHETAVKMVAFKKGKGRAG